MWGLVMRGAMWAFPALAGYFVNDIGDGLAKVLPKETGEKVRDEKGEFKWWYIASIFVALGAAVYFLFGKKGKRGGMFAIIGGGVCFALDAYFGTSDASFGTALITLTTGVGVVSSINTPFLPERIAYAASTQLSAIKISVQGDGVIFDSDTNGLNHIGVSRIIGQVTNNFVISLANGLIKGKNTLFEFTNSAAQTPTVYYDSDSTPTNQGNDQALFLQTMKVAVLQGGSDYTDFATLSLPSLAATDSITILYNDGTVQANMNRADLQYRLGYLQTIVNTPVYMIDNFDQRIKSVTVIAGSAQTGYMQRFAPSVSRGVISGQPNQTV